MTIGQLFISLGFKVEGKEKLDEAERGMLKAAVKASALAVAVNAINWAFLRMVDRGREAAVVLKNFAGATGLSADELQRWRAAAAVEDVDAAEIDKTIAGIQKATAAIKFGEGNIAPFQLLGISPQSNPFQILEQLRRRMKDLQPDVAAFIAGQLGVGDGVFQMLRSANFELDRMDKRLRMTEDERAALIGLNRAWKEFLFTVAAIGNKLAATLAPALAFAVRGVNLASGAALRFRNVLVPVAIATTALGVALAAMAGALTLAAGAVALLQIVAIPLVATFAAWGVAIAVIVGALAALALMLDDFWTAVSGGKSVFKWEVAIKGVNLLADAMQRVVDLKDKIGGSLFSSQDEWRRDMAGAMARRSFAGGAGGNWKQENNVRISVDGARSPEETARATADAVSEAVGDASYQMPLPNH